MKPFSKPILVTRPYLPDLKAYQEGIAEIWKNQWLTNNGPILQRYVKQLEVFFGTSNICAFNNGTLALQIALQGMKIEGEVITTPFTFVATAHCLVWNNIKPVFVDIDPQTYTIDPKAVEAAITPRTTAILAVHVFGTPCHLEALQRIADKHRIVLIYDAAHAFGVKVIEPENSPNDIEDHKPVTQSGAEDRSIDGTTLTPSKTESRFFKNIGLFGDCSMFSLHSTKLYHSIEGGLLSFNDSGHKKTFEYLRNFGFENETEVMMVGTNAKMNEMQALMGDLMLPKVPEIIAKRKLLAQAYYERLKDIPGIDIHCLDHLLHSENSVIPNFAYIPVEIMANYGSSRDVLYEKLKLYNIFARRYFYPLITDFECYQNGEKKKAMPVAKRVADQILTLPIYYDLEIDDINRISEIIAYLRR